MTIEDNEKFLKDLDKLFTKAQISYIPIGSYNAVTGGCQSRFNVGKQEYLAKFDKGVRGTNIPDIVSITKDGEVLSSLLGKCISLDLV